MKKDNKQALDIEEAFRPVILTDEEIRAEESNNTIAYIRLLASLDKSILILTSNSKDINRVISDMQADKVVSLDEYLDNNEIETMDKCLVGQVELENVYDVKKLLIENQLIVTVQLSESEEENISIVDNINFESNPFDVVIIADEVYEEGIRDFAIIE